MPVGLCLYDENGNLTFDATSISSLFILEETLDLPSYSDKTYWNPQPHWSLGGYLYTKKPLPPKFAQYNPQNSIVYVAFYSNDSTNVPWISNYNPCKIRSDLTLFGYKDAYFDDGEITPKIIKIQLHVYTYKGAKESNIIV